MRTPSRWALMIPSLTPRVRPKSSALRINCFINEENVSDENQNKRNHIMQLSDRRVSTQAMIGGGNICSSNLRNTNSRKREANDKCLVKVFNSSVENRVEKAATRFKSQRKYVVDPLCTGSVQARTNLAMGKFFWRRCRAEPIP